MLKLNNPPNHSAPELILVSGSKVQTPLVIISFSSSIRVHDKNRNSVSLEGGVCVCVWGGGGMAGGPGGGYNYW